MVKYRHWIISSARSFGRDNKQGCAYTLVHSPFISPMWFLFQSQIWQLTVHWNHICEHCNEAPNSIFLLLPHLFFSYSLTLFSREVPSCAIFLGLFSCSLPFIYWLSLQVTQTALRWVQMFSGYQRPILWPCTDLIRFAWPFLLWGSSFLRLD